MKHDKHLRRIFHPPGTVPGRPRGRKIVRSPAPDLVAEQNLSGYQGKHQSDGLVADHNLLDELQSLLSQLGAAKIILTLYLVEFDGLPQRLARPLLQEAAGSCAMLRLPSLGRHLVIYLGPEPSPDTGGFLGRLRRGLASLMPPNMAPDLQECAWAEVRSLRRCNHDIAAPAYLLLDLSTAAAAGAGNCGLVDGGYSGRPAAIRGSIKSARSSDRR